MDAGTETSSVFPRVLNKPTIVCLRSVPSWRTPAGVAGIEHSFRGDRILVDSKDFGVLQLFLQIRLVEVRYGLSMPPLGASTAKPLPGTPAVSSLPFCKRSYPCARLGNRFTSSSTSQLCRRGARRQQLRAANRRHQRTDAPDDSIGCASRLSATAARGPRDGSWFPCDRLARWGTAPAKCSLDLDQRK